MSNMIKVADLFGLQYFMSNEVESRHHEVLVKNENGQQAIFILSTGIKVKGDLSSDEEIKASNLILEFKEEFLDYLKQLSG